MHDANSVFGRVSHTCLGCWQAHLVELRSDRTLSVPDLMQAFLAVCGGERASWHRASALQTTPLRLFATPFPAPVSFWSFSPPVLPASPLLRAPFPNLLFPPNTLLPRARARNLLLLFCHLLRS